MGGDDDNDDDKDDGVDGNYHDDDDDNEDYANNNAMAWLNMIMTKLDGVYDKIDKFPWTRWWPI